jgi:hypothetical protein
MLLTGLTWQGVGMFIAIIVTVELIRLLTDTSYNYGEVGLFACWVLPVSIGLIVLKPSVYRHLSQPYALVAILYPLFILFTSILVSITQRSNGLKRLLSFYGLLPMGIGVMFCSCLAFVLVTYILGATYLLNALFQSSTSPFGLHPLFQTIGELQKLGQLGWGLWPGMLFILIVIGLVLVVRDICKALDLSRYWAIGSIEVIVFGIAFSRLSSGISMANFTETSHTLTIYWGSIAVGLLGLISGFIYANLKSGAEGYLLIDRITPVKIFLVVWSIFMLIALRSAVRFVFLFVIPGTILGAYAIVWIFKRCILKSKLPLLYLLYIVSILWQVFALFGDRIGWRYMYISVYICLAILTISIILFVTKHTARSGLPYKLSVTALSLYTIGFVSISPSPPLGGYAFQMRKEVPRLLLAGEKPTQNALEWIGRNTDANAVIAAKWEYGSWINLLGNRANIVHEQQRLYWVDLMTREFFLGNDVTGALEFFKTHKVDYLFLTTRDIKGLNRIAREPGMQKEPMGVLIFGSVVQETSLEVENSVIKECYRYCRLGARIAPGAFDPTLDSEEFSAKRWRPYSIYLQLRKTPDSMETISALIELQLHGKAKYIAPQRIYCRDKILYPENAQGFSGSVIICSERDDMNAPERWHVVYLAPQTQRLLPIRIFLLNEMPEIFERVYPPYDAVEPGEYRAQVWRIHYPSNVTTRPEYLQLGSLAATGF